VSELQNVAAKVMSKALFPSPKHFKKAMAYGDIVVKLEFLLLDLLNSLFWSSALELTIFVVCLILFMSSPNDMAWFWWFILHVPRGIIGLLLVSKLPRTHDIIKTASIPSDDQMSFDDIFSCMNFAAKEALDHFGAMTKKSLRIYLVLTILCALIDFRYLFVAMNSYGEEKQPYREVTMLISSLSFFIIDVQYLIWLKSLNQRIPTYLSASISPLVYGVLEAAYEAIGKIIRDQREKREIEL
jgi:hypothetical protein